MYTYYIFRLLRSLSLFFAIALLSGCVTTMQIDRSYTAVSQDNRIQFVVLHYTFGNFDSSLKTLTQGPVSSHYLVDVNPPRVLQLVDENKRAYHAGVSYWKGVTGLNASSIGIEIVNAGERPGASGLVWTDYPKEQIDVVIALVKKIVTEHNIPPERVLGHSDIAPNRKVDPGPKFPWKRLADLGLVLWPDEAKTAQRIRGFEAQLPDVLWFQRKLAAHGFNPPLNNELDEATRQIISAFQMKYRQSNFDGKPDAQTAALLDELTQGK